LIKAGNAELNTAVIFVYKIAYHPDTIHKLSIQRLDYFYFFIFYRIINEYIIFIILQAKAAYRLCFS
jgi:hypothetical protein